MIIKELFKTRTDGLNLYRTYSDRGVYIHKVGTKEKYTEAIDIETSNFTYEETDELIEIEKVEETDEHKEPIEVS